jgi:hypothetical protein
MLIYNNLIDLSKEDNPRVTEIIYSLITSKWKEIQKSDISY